VESSGIYFWSIWLRAIALAFVRGFEIDNTVLTDFRLYVYPRSYDKKKIECRVLGKVGLWERGRRKEIITETPQNWLLEKLKNKSLI